MSESKTITVGGVGFEPITSPGPCTICGKPADGLSFMGNPDGRSWQLCGSGPCWAKANRQSDKLEADHEITLDEKQLNLAAGNYCADVLKALPAGVYAQSQLSVIMNAKKGSLTAVFRAWGPRKPIQPREATVTATPAAGEPAVRRGKHGDPWKFHHPACKKPDGHEGHCIDPKGYEPTEETEEP